ncbi:MAG: hypothetical protein ACXVA9_11045 [Bdellovibrionales bacterium]
MRRLPLFFILVSLFAPQAHAVKNLYSLCERSLMVDADIQVKLASDQIALRGNLDYYWEQGMEDQVGWVMTDDFLKKNITPAPTHNMRWLGNGDKVFVLDETGKVAISGYFGQRREPQEITIGSKSYFVAPNTPYLYRDKELTEPLTSNKELREHFMRKARVVVIQTLSEEQLSTLQDLLKPWFERYDINSKQMERFVRVGRRRAVELAHFEELHRGSMKVATSSQESQTYSVVTEELLPGPTYRIHQYSLAEGPTQLELENGDRIMLLNEDGLVTLEGEIGSDQLPSASKDLEAMDALSKKIHASSSAVVLKLNLRKLD